MRTNITFALAALTAVSLTASVRAEEEHRELGPHVHGHGIFDIAVEGNKVAMELEVPGMDIVGFEHEASTDAQKAAVEKAKADLAKPLSLFKLPASAGCSVKEAKIAIEAEHEHEHESEHEGGNTHVAKDEEHAEHARSDHDEDEHDEHHHNSFHVTYALDCAKPAELSGITFDYFKAFAGAQTLTVNVVTAKGQNSYEVSRAKPRLGLGGLM
jgi:Protein of unknown function (DUF2796)